MSGHKPSEIDLYLKMNANERLAAGGLTCSLRKNYGVLVAIQGKPIGVWGYPDDRLCFRRLNTWETLVEVNSVEEALEASIAMTRA